jgi:hypothetical protein
MESIAFQVAAMRLLVTRQLSVFIRILTFSAKELISVKRSHLFQESKHPIIPHTSFWATSLRV